MCRHLGYLGAPVPIGGLLTRGEHSLRSQAWAPRDMRGGGAINADGFGVAWWNPAAAVPGDTENIGVRAHGGPTDAVGSGGDHHPVNSVIASRYRNPAPIWTDPAVDEVLPQLRSGAVLAAIRSATVGMPVERNACAPFTHGHWAFSHNGAIPQWQRVLTAVAAEFGTPSLLAAESHTDSATLWVILADLLDNPRRAIGSELGGPAATAEILRHMVLEILAHSPRARLNLLLGDGETLWATTVHHSLSVLVTDDTAVVSSEPYDDDPRWRSVPDRQLVTARPGALSVASLESEVSERARS
ncbi:class II glutamine amidotransferase [Nocardia transvalensis]|uniref:class II glutamine amidotransferase n=1 Tax=Nocardia transvalensis TaxID=37333 RepID=UPI00189421E1|nr:class II glutamine amidotransferase [Nocardia transvalensis]MBF6330688.1 class II glutamine amidotransferase [Nocardia transvalensis]